MGSDEESEAEMTEENKSYPAYSLSGGSSSRAQAELQLHCRRNGHLSNWIEQRILSA